MGQIPDADEVREKITQSYKKSEKLYKESCEHLEAEPGSKEHHRGLEKLMKAVYHKNEAMYKSLNLMSSQISDIAFRFSPDNPLNDDFSRDTRL